MELATTLLALRIDAVDCSGFPTVTGVGRDGAKCYGIRAGLSAGYVVARGLRTHEGQEEYFERSPLLPTTNAL